MQKNKKVLPQRATAEVELCERCISQRAPVRIILKNGFQMNGTLETYDSVGLLLKNTNGRKTFIYKTEISSLIPRGVTLTGDMLYVPDEERKGRNVETEVFCIDTVLLIYHTNGHCSEVRCELEDEDGAWVREAKSGERMYIYKSAISNIQFNEQS